MEMKALRKLAISLAALVLGASAANAQSGWFITLAGGGNFAWEGLFNRDGSIGMKPGAFLEIGKYVGETFAIGAGVDGWSINNPRFFPDGINYLYIHANAYWDVTKDFTTMGDNPAVSFIPYLHLGGVLASGSSFAGGIGVKTPIHLGKVVSIVPDIRSTEMADAVFRSSGSGVIVVLAASLGLSFAF